jgi:hypothetical protein
LYGLVFFFKEYIPNAVKLRKKPPLLLERVGVRRINTGNIPSNPPSP